MTTCRKVTYIQVAVEASLLYLYNGLIGRPGVHTITSSKRADTQCRPERGH